MRLPLGLLLVALTLSGCDASDPEAAQTDFTEATPQRAADCGNCTETPSNTQCKRPAGRGISTIYQTIDGGYGASDSQEYYNLGDVIYVGCQDGYYTPHGTYTCQSTGTGSDWDPPISCTERCKEPAGPGIETIYPLNVQYTQSDSQKYYNPEDVIDVRCSRGYYPRQRRYTCRHNGTGSDWDPPVSCTQKCEKSGFLDQNLVFIPHQRYYEPNAWVTVTCVQGFKSTVGAVRCKREGGVWDPDVGSIKCIPQCKKPAGRGISTIYQVIDGGYEASDSQYYTPGDVIYVGCQTGYYSPNERYTCQSTGTGSDWDPPVSCTAQCKKPSGGGVYSLNPNKLYYNRGDSVTVWCSAGYHPTYVMVTCMTPGDSSDWDVRVPCIKKCEKSGFLDQNLVFTPHQRYYEPNAWVTVTCVQGFKSTVGTIRCKREGGVWDSDVGSIKCIPQCVKPSGEGLRSLSPDAPYYNPGDSVTVTCADGFQPSSINLRCRRFSAGSEWDVPVPCVRILVTALTSTSDSISVQWACEPDPCLRHWEFTTNCCPVPMGKKRTCQTITTKGNATFSNLLPFTEYEVTLYGGVSGKKASIYWEPRKIKTQEAAPDRPEIVKYPNIAENTVKWRLKARRGIITGYQMNISAQRDYNNSFAENESHRFPPNVTEFQIPFKHGTNYTITLRGFTAAGAGGYTEWSLETPIADPHVHPQQTVSVGATMTGLQLHPVPDLNGPISHYEVILSTRKNVSEACAGYISTHYNSSISPSLYTAALLPAENLTQPITLTLGDGRHYSGFFNPPLISNQNYTVYVRITSKWREEEKSSCALVSSFQVTGRSSTPLVAGLGAAAGIFLIVLSLVVFWKLGLYRSLRSKSIKSAGIPLKKKEPPGQKKDIPVRELLEVVKRFRASELTTAEESDAEEDASALPLGRFQEYKALPAGSLGPSEVATMEANIGKNRYKKVIPYDGSRVVLRSTPTGSDYINASYIDGYKSPKFFIATQGPLPDTLADFWYMVWQENSPVIVMLTGLEENNKVKSACYWPENTETYGDIRVSLERVTQTGNVTARRFTLKKAQSAVQKTVDHFHYLQWPDHGVPTKPSGLSQLLEQMNTSKGPGAGPAIVHCSAGIGRTGTFIALDILLKMAKETRKVNVFNCVLRLRRQRANMVQNKEQYAFLYDVLLETLLCGVTCVAVPDIQKHIQTATNTNRFTNEFQALEQLNELYGISCFKQGKKPENSDKNRYPRHPARSGDHCRPILMSTSSTQNPSGYINAMFVSSNCQDDVFLVTQLPLKQTVSDFWALVWDYRCRSVVLMHGPREMKEICEQFWPDRSEVKYGGLCVKRISESSAPGYTETTFSVRQQNECLEVKFWQVTCWPQDQPVPSDPGAFIHLIGVVEKHQQQMADSRIVVTCCDGASRSGLFCAGSVVCDQIRSDGHLDVSQAVRSLRKRRIQLIPNADQYVFCYTMAQSYVESFETYGNFK